MSDYNSNQQYYGQPAPVYYGQPVVVAGGAVGATSQGQYQQPQQQYLVAGQPQANYTQPQQYTQPTQYSQPMAPMGESQFAKPPPPPQQQQQVSVQGGSTGFVPGDVVKHNPNERFAAPEGCRDTIWAILFVIQVFVVFVFACYFATHNGCSNGVNSNGQACPDDFKMSGKMWGMVILLLVASAIFSAIYLSIVRAYPLGIIKFTLGASVVLGFLMALILFAVGEIVGGVFMLLFALLQCLWVYLIRNRIPFSATILGIAAETMSKFPAMVYTSYAFIVAQSVWLIIWIVAASSILNSMNNSGTSGGGQGLAVFFLLLSFYWTSQVLKNIVHVTCSGTFATWYFLYPANMPSNPTVAALKRASWTSLGSICLGSLIIAVLQTMRSMLRMGRNNRNGFVRCCVMCILNVLESLIRFFNVYAFTHVAVYGSTYCEAAKQTWGLLKARGWDLLINDQIISPVLSFGAVLVGLLCGCVAVLLGYVAWGIQYWGFWAFLGFLIGFAVSLCAMEVVESCIATLFVCFAEDPDALARSKPTEYNRLDQAFRGRMVEVNAQNQQQGNQNN